MSGISTHILDISLGKPAAGVQVVLDFQGPDQAWLTLTRSHTDPDGRCKPLLTQELVQPGIYRITFATSAYFHSLNQPTLYPEVTVTFTVIPAQPNYHIPLLLSPFGYSTYRGT